MRKLVLGMALASTALATPALARDKSWYIEGDAGGLIVEDQHLIVPAGALETVQTKVGYDGGGELGYDFGGFRLETEASYRRAKNRRDITTVGVVYNQSAAHQLGGGAEALSFMANGLLDFGPDNGLQGFVGGGVGVARVKTSVLTPVPALSVIDYSTGFAWQAIAGLRMPLSYHWDIGAKYRYFRAEGGDHFVGITGTPIHDKFRSHSLLATLTYNFGEPPAPPPPPPPPMAPPPPPPPPMAPPPPPPPPCNKGPYIVFFDWDKSDITPEAATILDSAVQAYGNCGTVPIMLAGYTDLSGTQKYNLGLSARRNTSVRGYLTAHGIADGSITSQAFGKLNPRVPTADGVRELQNRRVEITYGPGSGN